MKVVISKDQIVSGDHVSAVSEPGVITVSDAMALVKRAYDAGTRGQDLEFETVKEEAATETATATEESSQEENAAGETEETKDEA